MIGQSSRECIIEFSQAPNKFYVVGLDLAKEIFHVIELFDK